MRIELTYIFEHDKWKVGVVSHTPFGPNNESLLVYEDIGKREARIILSNCMFNKNYELSRETGELTSKITIRGYSEI